MGIKSLLAKPFAKYIAKQVKKEAVAALAYQQKTFAYLMQNLAQTAFGKDHRITSTTSYHEFKQRTSA